ncbi:hypothetical protein [Tautonia plasticadhaerens]|uniref:Uncharacterized protein n=1 Tax=Tautonia plasticadhaerens TaxID=2527974 RepID=A0A518H247_9BACT|nr:hypothetical protein [Tautonia plasticadhaerens]QDV34897.1 hypothetical protein ElP_27940 [Tautonia plasticadhaerens]
MPISLPPKLGLVRCNFGLETNTQTYTSPLTRNTQRAILAGSRWIMTATIRRMRKDDQLARNWIAFFLKCQGMGESFYAYDPDRKGSKGLQGGTPLVNGSFQSGTTLAIDGCTANVTGWARAGDYFSANGELKQLTADVNTNGSGQATLNFMPAWRGSPTDNSAVNFTNPTCTMILVDDRQGMWDADVMGVYEEKTFSAMEVF